MKKSLLTLALIMATCTTAQENKKPYHVNIHAGLHVFDDASYLVDSAAYGVSTSIYENESQLYALQLGYEHLNTVSFEGIDLTTDINRYMLNIVVDGEEELGTTPYVLIGGGYESLSTVYSEYTQTKNQAFLNAGLGFKYRISENFNMTLEARALGKFDSESLDYGVKLGLGYMFGTRWQKKPKQLFALEEPIQEVKRRTNNKPIIKQVEKDKKWITPEVVEEMFSAQNQERVSIAPESIVQDSSIVKMQEKYKTLKAQMVRNETLLSDKLATLEAMLSDKKLALSKAKKDEVEAQRIAKEKRIVRTQALSQAQDIRNGIVIFTDVQAPKEQSEYERLRVPKEKKEKLMAEIALEKEVHEQTDNLYIRNGMVVFSD